MNYSQFKAFMMNEFFVFNPHATSKTKMGRVSKIIMIRGTFKNRASVHKELTLAEVMEIDSVRQSNMVYSKKEDLFGSRKYYKQMMKREDLINFIIKNKFVQHKEKFF